VEPESFDHKPAVSTADIVAEAQRRLQTQRGIGHTGRRRWAIGLNRGVLWLAHHWLAVANLIIGLYLMGAVVPPVLMKIGATRTAQGFYLFYDVACHQYPFRSWFLFGQKFAYPLKEQLSVAELNQSSHFLGNETMGYKLALCQRDVAIYGIIFLAGVGYGIQRKKHTISPLPIWLYFVFGIMPIMLDGGIQWLSSVLEVLFPAWIVYHFETIPAMRVLTGILFGAGMVAATYPYMDEYFEDIQIALKEKLRRALNDPNPHLKDSDPSKV